MPRRGRQALGRAQARHAAVRQPQCLRHHRDGGSSHRPRRAEGAARRVDLAIGTGSRDHRTRARGRPAAPHRHRLRVAGHGPAIRAGRLRRRPFEPAALVGTPTRDRQDRQVLHPRRCHGADQGADLARPDAAGRDVRHPARRRGYRDRGRTPCRARSRHRTGPGLFPGPSPADARDEHPPGRRRDDHQRGDRRAARDHPRRRGRLHARAPRRQRAAATSAHADRRCRQAARRRAGAARGRARR